MKGRSMQHYFLSASQHKHIEQRINMMPKKHRNQLLNKSMLDGSAKREQEDLSLPSISVSMRLQDDLQEVKSISELSVWQKVQILAFNCVESMIMALLMYNAIIPCNLSTILNLVIVAYMSIFFTPQKQCNIR